MSHGTSGSTSNPWQGFTEQELGKLIDFKEDEQGVEFNVQKYAAYIPMTCCVLTDMTGENHCAHEPIPKAVFPGPTRWQKFRAAFKRRKYQFVVWLAKLDEDSICNEWYWRRDD